MVIRPLLVALTLLLGSGCSAVKKDSTTGVSRSLPEEPPPPAPPPPEKSADSGADPLLGISEPFHGRSVQGGEILSDVGLLDELAPYDLVCVGEQPDSAHSHWAQLAVLYGLALRAEMSGRQLGLGLEMVENRFEPELELYYEGKLDLAHLPDAIEWTAHWHHDFALYRPLFELADSRRIPILGLDAPREVTRSIARGGFRELADATEEGRTEKSDLDNAAHQAGFDATVGKRSHRVNPQHLHAAEVFRVETMAEQAGSWLRQQQPARQMMVAAGIGHCRTFEIPSRVQRLLHGCRVISVLPSQGSASEAEAKGYDIVMVLGTAQ